MILKNLSTAPPDFYRYVHAETGYESKAIDPYTWFDNVCAHRKANNLPPVTFEQISAQLCETLPPGWCVHPSSEQATHSFVNTRLKWSDIVAGTKAYLALIAGGFQTVSQGEADRRASICASCYLQVNPQGCGSCVKIGRLITGSIASKATAHDSRLVNKACAVCHCGTKSIVHFPMPLLIQADSLDKQEAYPAHCWRKQGGVNYQPDAT